MVTKAESQEDIDQALAELLVLILARRFFGVGRLRIVIVDGIPQDACYVIEKHVRRHGLPPIPPKDLRSRQMYTSAHIEAALAGLRAKLLCRGFYGSGVLELKSEDGSIVSIRRTVERIEK